MNKNTKLDIDTLISDRLQSELNSISNNTITLDKYIACTDLKIFNSSMFNMLNTTQMQAIQNLNKAMSSSLDNYKSILPSINKSLNKQIAFTNLKTFNPSMFNILNSPQMQAIQNLNKAMSSSLDNYKSIFPSINKSLDIYQKKFQSIYDLFTPLTKQTKLISNLINTTNCNIPKFNIDTIERIKIDINDSISEIKLSDIEYVEELLTETNNEETLIVLNEVNNIISNYSYDHTISQKISKSAPTIIIMLLLIIMVYQHKEIETAVTFLFGIIEAFSKNVIGKTLSNMQKISKISSISFPENIFSNSYIIQNFRFTTSEHLSVHFSHSKNTIIVATLSFLSIVNIVSTKKDWSEIQYRTKENNIATGWVFTRYLKKFNNI